MQTSSRSTRLQINLPILTFPSSKFFPWAMCCGSGIKSVKGRLTFDVLSRRPGSPHKDQITRFWLTECAHLTCGEHFEGGGPHGPFQCSLLCTSVTESCPTGVPFHPEQESPNAPCPFCCKNKDARPKKLLFINGTSKGEYDSEIPDSYFDIPPPQIDGPEKGTEGLRVSEAKNYMST